jgi:hypothetical protein
MVFEHPGQQRGGGRGGGGGFSDQPMAGSAGQQQFVDQPMAGSSCKSASSRDQFDGPPTQQRQAQYGTGMRPSGGGGGGMGMGPGGGLQQPGRSPPKRRPPMSLAASDVRK